LKNLLCLTVLILAGCQAPVNESLTLESDHHQLVEGFIWAKNQALSYAHENDPVGNWFEAALPGRNAFCMRDVSHQTYGALMLGLEPHLKNMMHKFCVNISESKDWCSFWEINKQNLPAPVDYKSDQDFWYNLPANFDLIDACYRAFQWTADTSYLHDPDFNNFYEKSLNEYIRTWDTDNDGLMESPESNHPRGIATYWEAGGPHAETGADLVAAQIAAFKAYAKILLAKGLPNESARHFSKADKLYNQFNENWWYAEQKRFYTSHLKSEVFDTTLIPAMQIFSLYWDAVDQNRRPPLFANLKEGINVEENSYLAEVYFANGFIEQGFKQLMKQLDPDLPRREYPENSYTAIGTIVKHLIGLDSYATEDAILTRSGLPEEITWIKMKNIPVQNRLISIMQVGHEETEILLEKGEPILWHARFAGAHERLMINGRFRKAFVNSDDRGNKETQIAIMLKQGEQIRISLPRL
jgi:hypothetical protein